MDVAVLESNHADAATRKALRRLWDRAFGDRFDDNAADHAYGGVHVLVRDGGHLIGHASAVPRSIKFGDQPWRTVGYVEAVCTDPERQGDGVGRLVMERLHEEIASRWGSPFSRPDARPASTRGSVGSGGSGLRTRRHGTKSSSTGMRGSWC